MPPNPFTPDGLLRLHRTWQILSTALRTRHADTQSSLAPWLERTWMALGGPACVNETARDNAEAFFRLLDALAPSGVEVLRGDFDRRIARLCAAPDSRVRERFGVQIMTIHKAKGLGFQVVLLPGLERKEPSDKTELVAMLERSSAPLARDIDRTGDQAGDPASSELLLAPLSHRDIDKGDSLYGWVMQQREAREAAERKRLFYVACTRARLRLHLFATVTVANGNLGFPDKSSLLGAAWPALAPQMEARWAQRQAPESGLTLVASVEADHEAEAGSTVGQAAERATASVRIQPGTARESAGRNTLATTSETIDRLPTRWKPHPWAQDVALPGRERSGTGEPPQFERGEGSLAARARGTAMHALLERLALLFAEDAQNNASHHASLELAGHDHQLSLLPPGDTGGAAQINRESSPQRHPDHTGRRRMTTGTPSQSAAWRAILARAAEHTLRAAAFPPDRLRATATELTRIALAVAADPVGRWLLAPHAGALAESAWQLLDAGLTLRTLRVDRSFYAGNAPGDGGSTHLWIIDYKTGVRLSELPGPAHRDNWLAEQRSRYAPQLAAYGTALAAAASGPEARPIRYGLYFPELLHLLSWPAERPE